MMPPTVASTAVILAAALLIAWMPLLVPGANIALLTAADCFNLNANYSLYDGRCLRDALRIADSNDSLDAVVLAPGVWGCPPGSLLENDSLQLGSNLRLQSASWPALPGGLPDVNIACGGDSVLLGFSAFSPANSTVAGIRFGPLPFG